MRTRVVVQTLSGVMGFNGVCTEIVQHSFHKKYKGFCTHSAQAVKQLPVNAVETRLHVTGGLSNTPQVVYIK